MAKVEATRTWPHEGSMKGHTFSLDDESGLPSPLQDASRRARRLAPLTPAVKQREVAALNERYRVLYKCPLCEAAGVEYPVIAEEVVAHRLSHENATVRAMVQTILNQDHAHFDRIVEVLQELNPNVR